MADPTELVDEIRSFLPNLDPDVADLLAHDRGYAFEAWCFTVLGDRLRTHRKWGWDHPPGGLARFSRSRGTTLTISRDRLSHIANGAVGTARRSVCQSVNVEGRSQTTHALDLVLTDLEDCDDPLAYRHVGAAIEAKNTSVGPEIARELVGLQTDMVAWCDCPPGRSRLATLWLVSASGVSPNAAGMLDFYGISTVGSHELQAIAAGLDHAARALRFYRSACAVC